MDCRETRTLLTAFHDGELPAVDRVRVEGHLRGCPECGALLADLARADQAAGVPDPGPAYWDRFNARVMERVEREADVHGWTSAGTGRDAADSVVPADVHGWTSAGTGRDATGSTVPADGPEVAVLRPKHGWMRQQLRYLVPAAAAAALVVVVVRFGGMIPGAPTRPAVSEPSAPGSAGDRVARAKTETGGRGGQNAGTGGDATGSIVPAEVTKKGESASVARRLPRPALTDERFAAVTREEREHPADRPRSESKEEARRDRVGAPEGQGGPGAGADRDAPGPSASTALMAEQQVAGKAERASGMRIAKEPSAAEAPKAVSLGKTRAKDDLSNIASAPPRAGSPCELARTLAERERFREAEAAQRACLAGDLPEPAREKSLVFLAELLDRQARFAEADAVITEVDRRFPESRPLDLYRQQRPMVQKQPMAVPVTR